jgi:hypothetical protein
VREKEKKDERRWKTERKKEAREMKKEENPKKKKRTKRKKENPKKNSRELPNQSGNPTTNSPLNVNPNCQNISPRQPTQSYQLIIPLTT